MWLWRSRREFVDGSVEPEGSYSYRMYAYGRDGVFSAWSRTVTATTPPVPVVEGLIPLTSRHWVIPTTANVAGRFGGIFKTNLTLANLERGRHRGHGQALRNPGACEGGDHLVKSRYLLLLEQYSGKPSSDTGGPELSNSRPTSLFRSLRLRSTSILPTAETPPSSSTSPRPRFSIRDRP